MYIFLVNSYDCCSNSPPTLSLTPTLTVGLLTSKLLQLSLAALMPSPSVLINLTFLLRYSVINSFLHLLLLLFLSPLQLPQIRYSHGTGPSLFKMASNGVDGETNADRNVEIWKIKKLIKSLEAARGNGTSMISLIIPPKDQISRVAKMLADEFGTASNIKSRVNRLSVLGAITSVQQRLKLYNKVPPNGLVIYCGTIVTDEGKEKKVNIDFEPFRPINTSLYLCDNKFHTEALTALLADDNKFGFIVMDGNGALFGTLSGNTREVLHKFTVDLPKKHGRGGQSALRFARLRMEKRHNYVRKVAEVAVQLFITNDKPNISGLVLAGSADFKTELSQSDMFDPRLQAKIIKIVDVSYGGENGFNQAIELASDALANVKFIQEKKLIGRYFDEISQDTGKYCFGVEDTLKALEMGAVDILIVWENLDITRYILKNHSTDEEKILHLRPEQEKDKTHFMEKETGVELELVDQMPLLEWFANNYKNFGATLEIITDKSQEGAQFVKGFGGIGAILRYQVDFNILEAFHSLFSFLTTNLHHHFFFPPQLLVARVEQP
ncbi:ETF1 [Acanthosepion pharaonis]|uniref:Eukaryotic peptide chain release factor subunit 1 n=1 Tax=Acanthosepion pharaonis TaxID=158019 RepID=A0A812CYJ7_ACAPH|nr:ETF1 [Sepia pharaonis]